jgi:hypothetical protein
MHAANGVAELGSELLLVKRTHRIYAAGASRRYKTSEQRGNDQDRGGDSESRYVSGPHSLYQPIQDTPGS